MYKNFELNEKGNIEFTPEQLEEFMKQIRKDALREVSDIEYSNNKHRIYFGSDEE